MSELTKYIEEQQLEINELKEELQNYQNLLKLVVGVGVSTLVGAYLAVILW